MTKPTLRTLTGAELGQKLQIDDNNNQLYWDGKRVRSQITLTGFQTLSAVVVVIAGLATIFSGSSSGLNNLATFVCSRGWNFPVGGCPPAAPPPAAAPASK